MMVFKAVSSILWVCIGLIMFSGCSTDSDTFEIKGQIKNAAHVHALILFEGDRKLDSVFLTETGKFKMTRSASLPRFFTLKAGELKIPLILQNGDELEVLADLQISNSEYSIQGSERSESLISFSNLVATKNQKENAMVEEFEEIAKNLDQSAILLLQEDYARKFEQFMEDYSAEVMSFAEKQDDLVAFYAINSLDPQYAEKIWIDFAPRMQKGFEEHRMVQQFLLEVESLKRLAIGQEAPEFSSLTPQNRVVKLADFKGKITLVDFWASWCVPCRQENPNLVNLYQKYKDKGFTIFGVSLDNNPGSWAKAIEDDHLQWVQVSDLKAWQSEVVELYRLKSIPSSFLLDENGIILAKNLRGKELADYLKNLLD